MTSETCSICRFELNTSCNVCKMQQRTTGCPVVIGECGHKFHKHCMEGWLHMHRECQYPGCIKKFIPTNDQELLALTNTEPNPISNVDNDSQTIDLKRLIVDIEEIKKMKDVELIVPNEDNIQQFNIKIKPSDGIYKGKWFRFNFTIPNSYPIKPPTVHILDNIWHPNITLVKDGGKICLPILQSQYYPCISLSMIVTHIQYLLQNPNPKDPINEQASIEQHKNYEEFKKHVDEYLNQMP